MVKKSIVILAGLVALVFISGVSSCEKYTLPSVSLEKDTLFVPCAGGLFNLSLNCNVDWRISNPYSASWAGIEPVAGSGDAVLSIDVDQNSDKAERTIQYTVKTECIEKILTVIQQSQ